MWNKTIWLECEWVLSLMMMDGKVDRWIGFVSCEILINLLHSLFFCHFFMKVLIGVVILGVWCYLKLKPDFFLNYSCCLEHLAWYFDVAKQLWSEGTLRYDVKGFPVRVFKIKIFLRLCSLSVCVLHSKRVGLNSRFWNISKKTGPNSRCEWHF